MNRICQRIIALLILLSGCSPSYAAYYFVSNSGTGAAAGTCMNIPMNFTKFKTLVLAPGDAVFLQRGNIFRDNYTLQQSGTSDTTRIVFAAYGIGADPVINGADLITGWGTVASNIASAPIAFSTKMVFLNGVWQQPARFPNAGYLPITSASTSTGFTSTSLGQAANFWVNSGVSYKPDKFVWAQTVVSAFSAGHVTFPNTGYTAPVGNGFYLFGLLSALDTVGEFAYNIPDGRLYLWFGALNPATQTVEASRRQFGFSATNKNFFTIQNIRFTKNWEDGIEITNCNKYTVQFCETDHNYKKGVQATSSTNGVVSNNNNHDNYGKGIMLYQCGGRNYIAANTVKAVGMVPGYGTDGEIGGQGIEVDVTGTDTTFISENILDSISYNGIHFSKRCYISKNDVNHFCRWLDDGGAYYVYGSTNGPNCYLLNNIARHGIGNNDAIRVADTGMKAAGFYWDDSTHGITATENTTDTTSWISGFEHNSANNIWTNNTFFGCGKEAAFVQQTDLATLGSTGNALNGNIFYSTDATVRSLYNWNANINDTTHFGTYSGNYYINPYLATPIRVEEPAGANNYTVAQWGGKDATGHTNVNGSPPVNLNVIFVNNTFYAKTYPLVGTWKNISGGAVTTSITLLPFTSQILVAPTSIFLSTTDGDDSRTLSQAQNPATPWKTLAKINANWGSVAAGSSVLLKKGDVFPGSLTTTANGTAQSPVTLSYYGTAANPPVIDGTVTASGWTSLGGGVWESAAMTTGATVNMVLIDGQEYAMGRSPNANASNGGYLTFEAHTSSSITDNTNPFDNTWVNATLAVRTVRHVIETAPVTNITGNVITHSGTFTYNADMQNGFGFFMENDIKTLDQFGEWYYNPSTKKIDMFFGAELPASHTIKVSAIDNLLTVHSDYLTVDGVNFSGANVASIYNSNAGVDNLTVKNCNISFSGINAITLAGVTNFLLDSCTIQYANSNGIDLFFANPTAIIRKSTFRNISTLNGMMKNDEGGRHGMGIYNGDGMTCNNNTFLNMGYIPIYFLGNNNLIQNNYIDTFCNVLDDGGGIYTFVGSGNQTYSNRIVNANIVLNGVGAPNGTFNADPNYIPAEGLYMDENTNNVTLSNNTVANCAHNGIFMNNARTITIRGNLIYNNFSSIRVVHNGGGAPAVTGMDFKANKQLARTATQLIVDMFSVNNDFGTYGSIDSNIYARPIAQTAINQTSWFGNTTNTYTLAQWRTATGYDTHTSASPMSISSVNDILFQYNVASINKIIYLNGSYMGLDGTIYSGSITLLPYTSIALLKIPAP